MKLHSEGNSSNSPWLHPKPEAEVSCPKPFKGRTMSAVGGGEGNQTTPHQANDITTSMSIIRPQPGLFPRGYLANGLSSSLGCECKRHWHDDTWTVTIWVLSEFRSGPLSPHDVLAHVAVTCSSTRILRMQLRTGRAPISFKGFVTRSVMPMLLRRMAAGQRLRRVRIPQVRRTNDRKIHVTPPVSIDPGLHLYL